MAEAGRRYGLVEREWGNEVKRKRFEFILQAQQPVAHHEGSIGNQAMLMRERIFRLDGTSDLVPVITGDTMRHGLREAAAYATLDAAGLLGSRSFSEASLRLLFSGGQITGSAGGSVKLEDYRQMTDLLPALAILGGCAQNRSIPGRLFVDNAVLICDESSHLLPVWVESWLGDVRGGDVTLDSFRDHIEEETRVRMDPTLDPGKCQLLTDGSKGDVQTRLLTSEAAGETGNAKVKDKEKSTMLPRTAEVIAAGSLFWWGVEATLYSELEEDTFDVMCASFLTNARVGGKRGTGHGLVRSVAGFNVPTAGPMEGATKIESLGERVGIIFQRHITDRSEAIAEFLGRVKA